MKRALLSLLFVLLASPAFAQALPVCNWGDMIYKASSAYQCIPFDNTAGKFLQGQGASASPIWTFQAPASFLLPTQATNTFLGNTTGGNASPTPRTVSNILDTIGYDIIRPPTPGSIIYKSAVAPGNAWQALQPGTAGQVLVTGGLVNPPYWAATTLPSTSALLDGICVISGAVLYRDAANYAWNCLSPGTAGQVLSTGGGLNPPQWTTTGAVSLNSICTTVGALLYYKTPDNQWVCLSPGTAGQSLVTGGAGANPSWASATPSGAALTRTNDTNVTVTLGGAPNTALLQASSLTLGWAGTLAAGRLNANVVQSVVNGTNVTGSISAQSLTLGWTGALGITSGGTGTNSLIGFITGLQPLKGTTDHVIGINNGSWSDGSGTIGYSTGTGGVAGTGVCVATAMCVELNSATINYVATPAIGGQVSGALPNSSAADGTEVLLYLTHRISDGKIALIGSASDTIIDGNTFTTSAGAPGQIGLGYEARLRKRMPIYFSHTGAGALPTPLGGGVQYYVCTVPVFSPTVITVATSLANVNAGSCLTLGADTGGVNTMSWGVQHDVNFQLGVGVTTVDRRLPYFAFVWDYTRWNGVPNFQVAQGQSQVFLQSAGNDSAWQASAGTSVGSWTAIDLSFILANLNRNVRVLVNCVSPASLGGCYMRTKGGGSTNGTQVGAPAVLTVATVGQFDFVTDSENKIEFQTTGGAVLNVWVIGWNFIDPS